jgi:xylulokinase
LAALEAAIGRERLAHLTGQPPAPVYTIAKLMWLRVHDPDLVARTWKFLCYGDLIAFRLGAEPAVDHSMAARTMAFDIRRRDWSDEILAVAGIARDQLATPVPSGTPVGVVAPAVARDLGFVGAPVIVAGGHDQPCGAFGAGVARAGEAMLAIGTTACLAPVFPAPRDDLPERGYPCYPHVVPGAFITLAGNFTGASLLRWFRDQFGAEERRIAAATGRDVFELLIAEASAEPSPLLALPHFAGAGAPHDDPNAKGALVGLSFATTRGQIIRALLEGVMFEMALNRECLADAGVPIASLVAVGGGARSDRWLQIAADVLGVPVRRAPQPDAACRGAASLAARGLSQDDASVPIAAPPGNDVETFMPEPARAARYRERLEVYRVLYDALRPINHAL